LTPDADAPAPLSWATVIVLATVGAIAVANVYYLQPLLELIAEDFHADEQTAGMVSVGMQAGYALGILALVPLGDVLERRRLLVVMFFAVGAMLIVATLAPSATFLALTMLAIGFCTTAPQVLVPFAADIAPPRQRGRVIGTMQSGLILGTLFARVAGGFIGAHAGWRAVFGMAAAIMIASAFVLGRVLPVRQPHATLRYGELLRSVGSFVRRFPALRGSMCLGGLAFMTFAGIWTVFAFHLHDLGYGADIVGLIGLLSLLSAVAASWFGVLADRLGTLRTGTAGWALLLVTFLIFRFGGWSIWGIVIAAAIFPLAFQLNQISNQTRIFAIDDRARSRINTAYTFAMFGSGAVGAAAAAVVWQYGGWNAVCLLQIAWIAAMGPVLWWLRQSASTHRPSADTEARADARALFK
jgi:predicted MFS family arabinose efflux permease